MDAITPQGTFICTRCKQAKPTKDFRVDGHLRRGFTTRCKDCANSLAKGIRPRNVARREAAICSGGKKMCAACGEEKPILDFGPNNSDSSGSARKCRPCMAKSMRDWRYRKENGITAPKKAVIRDVVKIRKKWKDNRLFTQYGLTPEDRQRMIADQHGKCAICQNPFDLSKGTFHGAVHVDHNHSTGKVRGLLCSQCNFGVGNFKEKIKTLKNAIEYLRKYGDGK